MKLGSNDGLGNSDEDNNVCGLFIALYDLTVDESWKIPAVE